MCVPIWRFCLDLGFACTLQLELGLDRQKFCGRWLQLIPPGQSPCRPHSSKSEVSARLGMFHKRQDAAPITLEFRMRRTRSFATCLVRDFLPNEGRVGGNPAWRGNDHDPSGLRSSSRPVVKLVRGDNHSVQGRH